MLTKTEINGILEAKGFTCSNIDEYKNLDTVLRLQCKNGHCLEASLKTVRNVNFKCPKCEGQESISKDLSNIAPPAKEGYRVVGIDNATENVGISVFDNKKLVFYHLFHFEGDTVSRMLKNRILLEEHILAQWEPDLVVIEDIQYQNNIITFKVLAELLGSTLVSLRKAGVRYETVLSKVWRSHFMINGKTRPQQKQQAIDKIKEMYGLTVNDDVAESILIGKYATDMLRQTEIKKLF